MIRFISHPFVPARLFAGVLLACMTASDAHAAQQSKDGAAAMSNLPDEPAITLGLSPAAAATAPAAGAPAMAASATAANAARVPASEFLRGVDGFAPVLNGSPLSASLDAADQGPQASPAQQTQATGASPSREPQEGDLGRRTGQQPKRILGLMPNYRSVSSGVTPPPPTVEQNFKVATRQAFDYSAFVFLGITSAAAYAQGSHPSLETYNGGNAVFWGYLWRGFIDKTDGNYLAAFILPTILREDTRYYAMGSGSKWRRLGYAASRVAIARTYNGHTTPNIAGIGGKIAAQAISPYYYPPGSSDFGVLATKFAYAIARDMGFTVFREFYPDIAIHALHRNP